MIEEENINNYSTNKLQKKKKKTGFFESSLREINSEFI